jgi:hypothetical protein
MADRSLYVVISLLSTINVGETSASAAPRLDRHGDECGDPTNPPANERPRGVASHERDHDPGQRQDQPETNGRRVAEQAPHMGIIPPWA